MKHSPTVVMLVNFIPNQWRTVERYLLLLAERLHARGWRTVHVFAGPPGEEFAARLRELDSPYMVAKLPLTVRGAVRLGRLLRPYEPSILHTRFLSKFGAGLPALKWASGARWLIVGDHSSGALRPRSGVAKWLTQARGRLAGLYIDRVAAVSEFVRRRDVEQAYLPAGKVRVIYNGVPIQACPPREHATRPELMIAFAGQLIPEKGVLTLLRAVRRLVQEGQGPLRVRLAGRGAQEAGLRQFCADNGLAEQVEFLGQVDGVGRLFASADVVVIPSEWEEAFGLVVAEAMACEAALVVSDAGGIPEVVGADGEAGLIFRRGDVDDLVDKLRRVLGDAELRARMGRAGRQRVERMFTLEAMVDGYIRLYEELVSQCKWGTE